MIFLDGVVTITCFERDPNLLRVTVVMNKISSAALLLAVISVTTASAQSLSDREFGEKIALFGDGFLVERIEGPVIENPHHWVNRQAGNYVYRFMTGSDDGEEIQVEKHIPDEEDPDSAWQRQIGDSLIEHFEARGDRDIFIVEEIDHDHGYRIVIEPGVHVPSGLEPGDSWEVDVSIKAYDTSDGSFVDDGTMHAVNTYEGAYRVRTPAGLFDTVVIREDFVMKVGPLKAEDDRLLFYARDVGLVAEEEAIRASALFVFRVKEDSAKVLVHYPGELLGEMPASE